MGHISFSVLDKCYALTYSYSVICVGCNCCGRKEKGIKMWKARLKYHKEELKREINFDNWIEGFRKRQEKVKQSNIKYHKSHIKAIKERIKV